MNSTVTYKSIEVQPATDNQRERWDELVARSPQGTVVHRIAFLQTIASHADADLHLLIGQKGQEEVGLFPVFERSVGPVRVVFSPPPNMGLSVLGPAMLKLDGMKPQTQEKRVRRFIQASLDWIDDTINPAYEHVRTHPTFLDHRPFSWNEFDLTTRYTYVVDLQGGAEEVKGAFSTDARRNIRDTSEKVAVNKQDSENAINRVITHLQQRHDEQGISYPVESAFVQELSNNLHDECMTVYHVTVDGEYASGMIVLSDKKTAYRWQGGGRPVGDVDIPVNDRLDWRVMKDAIKAGREKYDLVGANTRGITQYKSKFGPNLQSYQSAEYHDFGMGTLASVYQWLS